MSKRAGFTLVETLIAIAIITLAVAGPLYTANRAIVAAETASDQLTASYLAQEGIEYVRLMRDNEYLAVYNTVNATLAWTNFISGTTVPAIGQCVAPYICTLSPQVGITPPTLTPCWGNICSAPFSLLVTNGMTFVRTIQAITISTVDEKIVSTVTWSFHSTTYSVTITDHLTPWQ